MASAVAELRPHSFSRSTCRPLVTGLAMLSSDLVAIALAWSLAVSGYVATGAKLALSDCFGVITLAILLPAIFANCGFYPGAGIGPVEELRGVIRLTAAAYMSLVLLTFLVQATPYPRTILIFAWILTMLFVLVGRNLVRKAAGSLPWWGCPAVLFGAGPGSSAVLRVLRNDPGIGIRVHVAVDERGSDESFEDLPFVVGLNNIPGLVHQTRIKRAIIAGPVNSVSVAELVRAYGRYFPSLIVCPDIRMPMSLCAEGGGLGGLLVLGVREKLLSRPSRLYKRMVDVILSSVLLALLSPFFLLVACAVITTSEGPVFYGHRRIGRDGKAFKMWKFRTMVANADEVLERHLEQDAQLRMEWGRDHKLRRDPRVTTVGSFMRKCSVDELPQIWNVLRGDMSLIGPRPIVSAEISRYGAEFDVFLRVLPGLTGLWQVSGRNDTTYQERVELDSYYANNWSPWLDLYILSRTLRAVVSGRGAC
jgi:Undecaprenyl-phosphate galactose phosphotransferase WbaP